MSAWAAVEAARDSAKAANSSVELGVAGLIVGAATLVAAFYAAWQAKRGADAAVHDARANAAAAHEIAEDRKRQLVAQARLHGGRFTFPDCTIRFDGNNIVSVRLLIENIGETGAVIEDSNYELECELGGDFHNVIKRAALNFNESPTILPGEQRQFSASLNFEPNENVVGSHTWFTTNLRIWLTWRDSFDFMVDEEWLARGTNVVGNLFNTSTLRQVSQVRRFVK